MIIFENGRETFVSRLFFVSLSLFVQKTLKYFPSLPIREMCPFCQIESERVEKMKLWDYMDSQSLSGAGNNLSSLQRFAGNGSAGAAFLEVFQDLNQQIMNSGSPAIADFRAENFSGSKVDESVSGNSFGFPEGRNKVRTTEKSAWIRDDSKTSSMAESKSDDFSRVADKRTEPSAAESGESLDEESGENSVVSRITSRLEALLQLMEKAQLDRKNSSDDEDLEEMVRKIASILESLGAITEQIQPAPEDDNWSNWTGIVQEIGGIGADFFSFGSDVATEIQIPESGLQIDPASEVTGQMETSQADQSSGSKQGFSEVFSELKTLLDAIEATVSNESGTEVMVKTTAGLKSPATVSPVMVDMMDELNVFSVDAAGGSEGSGLNALSGSGSNSPWILASLGLVAEGNDSSAELSAQGAEALEKFDSILENLVNKLTEEVSRDEGLTIDAASLSGEDSAPVVEQGSLELDAADQSSKVLGELISGEDLAVTDSGESEMQVEAEEGSETKISRDVKTEQADTDSGAGKRSPGEAIGEVKQEGRGHESRTVQNSVEKAASVTDQDSQAMTGIAAEANGSAQTSGTGTATGSSVIAGSTSAAMATESEGFRIHSGSSREEKGDASGNSMNFGSDGKSQRSSGSSEQSNVAVPVDFKDLLSSAKSSSTQSAQAGAQSLRADPQEIISQIMDKAKLVSTRESSSVTIALRPENLGKVEFELVFRDGIVTARFVTESNQVKELLESNMDHLRDSLQKAGIEVGGMDVSVGQERSGSSSGTGESWSSSGRPSVQQPTESVETQTGDSVNIRVHDGLLDIVA
ncbi:MAG: hypothetical protein CVV64_06345 [Candidatus Wallbacteria bacterium HGW-Wallbacteria-1]|uniref:Flagellar hook-length control protein-like C-terminal domain-containing protein n=1 Tax=Candidatus Wallbacteria bacterium HGW-Wallbacteria-1 TaxID=2013854 RepID=A0A2N1PSY3_9BACT|nr:MAG: hypothetical protein CVV64_06345 [Candidatus Wallbacteria bacterium HGW-Wallbacteria-1]